MNTILYISGLLIGIAVFIYILSIYEKAREKLSAPAQEKKSEQPAIKIEEGTIAFNKRPALPPGTRICPLCGSPLTKYEGLYANKNIRGDSAALVIMGCKYCYKESENSLIPKKSQI